MRSALVAMFVILPVSLALAIANVGVLGLALLPAVAGAGWLVSARAHARGAITAGVKWGLVASSIASVLFVIVTTILVELGGGYYFPNWERTPDLYILVVIVELFFVAAILAIPMSILGMAWAVITHSLEQYLHPPTP